MIAHIEVDGDVGADTCWPALADVGLGHLHDGEGHDGLSHTSPTAKHHTTIFRLPVRHTHTRATLQLCPPLTAFYLTLRAKVFRGKKVHGEFDIKVEQVSIVLLKTQS